MRERRERSTGSRSESAHKHRDVYTSTGDLVITDSVWNGYWLVPAAQTIIDWKLIQPPPPAPRVNWKDPKVFLACSNVKVDEIASYSEQNVCRVRYATGNQYEYEYVYDNAGIFAVTGWPDLPTAPPDIEFQLSEAFTKLQPSFKDAGVDGINIYTAILELADLKKTFTKSVWKLNKSFRDLPEKNLLINFGVLPLFSDIKAIYDIVTKLDGFIDSWNDAAYGGLVWDKHVSLDGPEDELSSETVYVGNISNSIQQTWRSTAATVTSGGKAHLYFKPKVISKSSRRSIYANALGLAEPLEGIWEAVPFSWAIDYFTNIGAIIAAWDEALPSMFKYDFVSAGYSTYSSVEATITVYQTVVYDRYWKSVKVIDPVTRFWKDKRYNRHPVSYEGMIDHMERPTDFSAGWNKGARQASYLASVAYLLSVKK